jgi:hypothetical protein
VRTIVLILALVTSPLGAAVCEVVCADHVAAGHHAAPVPEAAVTEHQHHEHMAPEAEAPASAAIAGPSTQATRALHSPVEDCAPASGQPATLRSAATAGALAPPARIEGAAAHSLRPVRPLAGGPPSGSSPPPPARSTIPLRI